MMILYATKASINYWLNAVLLRIMQLIYYDQMTLTLTPECQFGVKIHWTAFRTLSLIRPSSQKFTWSVQHKKLYLFRCESDKNQNTSTNSKRIIVELIIIHWTNQGLCKLVNEMLKEAENTQKWHYIIIDCWLSINECHIIVPDYFWLLWLLFVLFLLISRTQKWLHYPVIW